MLESAYTGYLTLLGWLGQWVKLKQHHPENDDFSKSVQPELASFEQIDARATMLGNHYRGIGVIVGILGGGIVFCALLPVGIALDEEITQRIGCLEVALMLLMIFLIGYGRKSGVRKTWIATRRQVESLRYQQLASGIMANDVLSIRTRLQTILAGDSGQVSYNQRKCEQYERAENFSNNFTWFGFFIALLGAVAHLLFHAPWLIFLTAFLPAFVGIVHAINGFLRIDELAEEHRLLSARLGNILDRLGGTKCSEDELLDLAKSAYQLLTDRDMRWAENAEKLEIKPA